MACLEHSVCISSVGSFPVCSEGSRVISFQFFLGVQSYFQLGNFYMISVGIGLPYLQQVRTPGSLSVHLGLSEYLGSIIKPRCCWYI